MGDALKMYIEGKIASRSSSRGQGSVRVSVVVLAYVTDCCYRRLLILVLPRVISVPRSHIVGCYPFDAAQNIAPILLSETISNSKCTWVTYYVLDSLYGGR